MWLKILPSAKKNNISGAVVAIDMAKAFDSLNHGFMQEAYRFFGFGENFVKMLFTFNF